MGTMINRRRVCGGKKGLLPSGYKQLEYLQSSGTQWIDTGVTPTANFDILLDGLIPQEQSATKILFGTSDDSILSNIYSNTHFSSGINGIYSNGGISYGGHNYKFRIGLSPHRILNYDGTIKELERPYTPSGSFRLLKSAYNSISGIARIYKIQLYDNTTPVFNLVPARRNSDNVLGMYDTVTGNFLTNQGTGTFIAGPEV